MRRRGIESIQLPPDESAKILDTLVSRITEKLASEGIKADAEIIANAARVARNPLISRLVSIASEPEPETDRILARLDSHRAMKKSWEDAVKDAVQAIKALPEWQKPKPAEEGEEHF